MPTGTVGVSTLLGMENELVMKSFKQKRQFAQNTVVIPQGLINTVLQNLHSSPSGGHLGVTRTISKHNIKSKAMGHKTQINLRHRTPICYSMTALVVFSISHILFR